jgi:hypothetical protein
MPSQIRVDLRDASNLELDMLRRKECGYKLADALALH